MSVWTRDEAVGMLRLCSAGKHWVTTPICDSCWANEHRCPPTLAEMGELVRGAEQLNELVERTRAKMRRAAEGGAL